VRRYSLCFDIVNVIMQKEQMHVFVAIEAERDLAHIFRRRNIFAGKTAGQDVLALDPPRRPTECPMGLQSAKAVFQTGKHILVSHTRENVRRQCPSDCRWMSDEELIAKSDEGLASDHAHRKLVRISSEFFEG
jgi:hypothetical protein